MIPSHPDVSISPPPTIKSERLSAIRRASELLKLASNPDRLKILLLLACENRSVSDLIGQFPEQLEQFVSRHLGLLRRGGLAECWGAGSFRIYGLTEVGRGLLHAVGKASDEAKPVG